MANEKDCWDIANTIAGCITAGATVGLLTYAWKQLPNEMKKWREQRTYDARLALSLEFLTVKLAVFDSIGAMLSDTLTSSEKKLSVIDNVRARRLKRGRKVYLQFLTFSDKFDILYPSEIESQKAFSELKNLLLAISQDFSATLEPVRGK